MVVVLIHFFTCVLFFGISDFFFSPTYCREASYCFAPLGTDATGSASDAVIFDRGAVRNGSAFGCLSVFRQRVGWKRGNRADVEYS